MITRQEWQAALEWAWNMVQEAGVVLRDGEFEQLEVADRFGACVFILDVAPRDVRFSKS